MEGLVESRDSSVNHLRFDLKHSSDHVTRRGTLEEITSEDNTLELLVCEQEEFRHRPLARAEVLYSDFVQSETTVNSSAVQRYIIFYDIATNQAVFKLCCQLRETCLPNYQDQVERVSK